MPVHISIKSSHLSYYKVHFNLYLKSYFELFGQLQKYPNFRISPFWISRCNLCVQNTWIASGYFFWTKNVQFPLSLSILSGFRFRSDLLSKVAVLTDTRTKQVCEDKSVPVCNTVVDNICSKPKVDLECR